MKKARVETFDRGELSAEGDEVSAIPGTPNHPVVKALEQDWHKVAALIMVKLGVTHVEITTEDMERIVSLSHNEMSTIVVQEKGNALHVRLMSMREAKAFAALHESGDV